MFAVLGLVFAGGGVAHAGQLDAYAINAASCTPGDPAIQNNRYTVGAGAVTYQPASTGLITLYCFVPEVQPLGNQAGTLAVTYRDSTGTSTTGFVDVSLLRMRLTDGALFTVATFLSDGFSDPGHTTQNSVSFSHTFDFLNYAYYLRVDMQRASTSDTVTFYAATLRQ